MALGGQALHRVGCQRDHVVAELHPMVRGHQEVVPGLGVQVLQGAPQLSWRWRGVSAVPQLGECAREMPPCSSWPDGGPKDPQVAPDSSSDRIAPGLWPVGSPLEDSHHHMRCQGLRRELQRCPPVGLDHRAPWGSEDMATGPTDRHPSPHDRHCLPAGVAGSPGHDNYGGHGLLVAHTRHSTPTKRS